MPPPYRSQFANTHIHALVVDDRVAYAVTLAGALATSGLHSATLLEPLLDGAVPSACDGGSHIALLALDLAESGAPQALTRDLDGAGWRVIVLAPDGERPRLAAAIEAGAAGWLAATVSLDRMVEAIHRLATGLSLNYADERFVLLRDLRASRDRAVRRVQPFAMLTPREQEVLASLAAGLTLEEIAEMDYVSPVTVRNQVQSVLGKLAARSRVEAVAMAYSTGWIAARANSDRT